MDILLNKLALDLTGLHETKEEALEEKESDLCHIYHSRIPSYFLITFRSALI
jgi:hypothetical protein